MFSAIPMPYFDWNDKNTKYMITAFPLVGVVCGFFNIFIFYLASFFNLSNLLTSILLVVSPIVITGGIHLDGYCDTKDALSSHQPIEKKLLILSDPHIGAFGVLSLFCYLLLNFAILFEIEKNITNLVLIATTFIISRCFSGIGVCSIQSAKNSGLAKTFSDSADKIKVRFTLILSLVFVFLFITLFIDIFYSIAIFFTAILTYLSWKNMILKEFNGLTGDLSGYFTQKVELYLLCCILVLELVFSL